MNCIVTMLTALAITRHFVSSSRPSFLVRAWSSSSFAPSTRSRHALLMLSSPIRNDVNRGTRRNLKSTLVMWGEEDAPSYDKEIPSSRTFSSDAQQRRPARRSRRSSSGWDDDDDTKNGGWEEEYNPRQQRQAQRRVNSRDSSSGWDDDGGYDRDSNKGGRSSRTSNSGWDDDQNDAGGYNSYEPYTYDNLPSRNRGRGAGGGDSYRRGGERGGGRGRGGRGRGERGRGRGRTDAVQRGRGRGSDSDSKPGSVKINLKLLENAGYEHLYGIAPVLNALKANERNFANPDDEEKEDLNDLLDLQERLSTVDGIDDEFSRALEDEFDEKKEEKREIKPEAKLAPYLFVQEGTLDNTKRSFRSDAKIKASSEIVALAKEHGLPVAEVDKGVLNTLCGSRPHQGFVLRCGGLDFEQMRNIPSAVGDDAKSNPLVWLALDEVVDPQNLGALLRSVFFLGGGGRVGVIVTSKNSSPLSPAVSAASSGALEFMTVYSTSNLPKLLNNAKDDGWRVLGAAAEVPEATDKRRDDTGANENDWDIDGEDGDDGAKQQQHELQQQCYDLYDVETNKPTILVLGSEGRGLRTLVGRACTSFVKIPGGSKITGEDDDSQAGVDSLNVSVTGGILLWHFLSGSRS
jgi:21S rRNA (GM2251-2'-O)-methyltransferase